MPLMGGARKRSRGNVEQPDGTRLEGWNFVQEKMLSHDEDMISDYADDIDTLLVFAGLFSAVLTAFLVVSLVLLQPDNSQTTNQILSVIALQNNVPPPMQPFLSATAESLPTSTAFTAPKDVATINTLWFTSLVLSLAAALFGILAKQWCREYLRWHSVIATARENVLARQMRFDAWERWKVGGFIAFIPAFLEIALVLFLVGLFIFVPTYSERSMTIVLSVVIGSVLLGVVVLTILPAFFRLCPFQTPTGWAVVKLAGLLRQPFWRTILYGVYIPLVLLLLVVTCGHAISWTFLETVNTYLGEQIEKRYEKLKNWRAYGLYSVKDSELCRSMPAAVDIKQACRDMSANFGEAAVDAVQTSTLFRALTWVRLGSNDDTVLAAIQEAVPTIHATILTTDVKVKPQFLSAIHAISPTDVSAVLKMARAHLYDITEGSLSFRAGPQLAFNLYYLVGPFINTRGRGLEDKPYPDACDAWASDSASLEVSHALILRELLSLVDDWLSLRAGTVITQRRAVAKRIALLLCVLRILPSEATRQAAEDAGPNLTLPWAETVEEVYQRLAPLRAAYEDGLVSMCVEMCRLLGPVKFEREQGEKYAIHVEKDHLFDLNQPGYTSDCECNLVSTWATLAVDIYHNTNQYEDANGRHLFVTSVSRVFETMRLRTNSFNPVMNDDEKIAPMTELLSCMADALRWSLVHSHPNCGAYRSLPWVKDIVQCATDRDRRSWVAGNEVLWSNFLIILRLLQTCIDRRLIPCMTVAADDETTSSSEASAAPAPEVVETPIYEFDRLLELLGHPELPELPDDLTGEALGARRRRAEPPTLGDLEPLDVHESDLPGAIVPEWPSSLAAAPSRSISVDAVASTGIDEVSLDGNTNPAHVAGSSNGDDTEARRTAGEDASPALDRTSTTPLPVLASSSCVHLEETSDVPIPSLSHPAHTQSESDAPPPRGSPSLPPERSGNDSDAETGEPPIEQPRPHSTQSSPRDGTLFTYPPTVSSRLASSDIGPLSLEPERVADEATSSTTTDSQAALGRDLNMSIDPTGQGHDVDAACVQGESVSETGYASVSSYEMEGDSDVYPLHALIPSRTLDNAATEDTRTSFLAAAGVTPHDDVPRPHPESRTDGPFITLSTLVTPSANRDVPALEMHEGRDTVAVSIDDTDRDLEAGPRIPSPVDEGPGEV